MADPPIEVLTAPRSAVADVHRADAAYARTAAGATGGDIPAVAIANREAMPRHNQFVPSRKQSVHTIDGRTLRTLVDDVGILAGISLADLQAVDADRGQHFVPLLRRGGRPRGFGADRQFDARRLRSAGRRGEKQESGG